MHKSDPAEQIAQNNAEMMRVYQQAQQANQDMANKLVKMSVEEQVSRGKNDLLGAIVDFFA
ncbi:MAG: hypothetical protein D6715_12905 [Calditrichaeota bacterium]|nr:MAG: hypothetical protein D6715_12905 [Calditrichota bacterium]